MKVFLFKGSNPYARDLLARELLGIEENQEFYTVTARQKDWISAEWMVVKDGDTERSQYLQLGRNRSDETIIVTGYRGLYSNLEASKLEKEELPSEKSKSEESDSEESNSEVSDFKTLNLKNKSALVFSPTFIPREKKQEELINNIILFEENSREYNELFERLKETIRDENFDVTNENVRLAFSSGEVVDLSPLSISIDQEQRQLLAEQLNEAMSGRLGNPAEPVLNSLVSCINYFLQELTLTKRVDIPFVWLRPRAKQSQQPGYLINVEERYKTAMIKFLSDLQVDFNDRLSYYAPVGDCAVPMRKSQGFSGVFNIDPIPLARALANKFDIKLSQPKKSPIVSAKKRQNGI